jgi:hypothetical protein
MTWDNAKTWLRWVYDWVTVIAAALLGVLVFLPIDQLGPLLPPDKAMVVMTVIAVIKGAAAYVQSQLADAE